MASSHLTSPLGNPAEVKKITDEILGLSTESLTLDSAISQVNKTAGDIANEHKTNFDIGEKLPISVGDFKQIWSQELAASRDAATLTALQLQKFFKIGVPVITAVQTKAQSKDVIAYLNKFAQAQSPLQLNPLQGFWGVTKSFTNAWILISEVARQAADILDKVTDQNVKKVVQDLITNLNPIAEGSAKVQKELENYATQIA